MLVTQKTASPQSAVRPTWCLFLLFLVPYLYFFPRWADWNENSHFALTQAIVVEHRLSIDDFYQSTGDYALYGGHHYTDKAPGLSFLAIPTYAAFRLVAPRIPSAFWNRMADSPALAATLQPGGAGLGSSRVEYAAALYLATFVVVSLPSAVLWLLVYAFLGELGLATAARLVVVVACGLGSVAFPYSTVFYNHQPAAFLIFSTFYLLFRIRQGKLSVAYLWLVGALLGLTVLTDFPSVVPGVCLLVYAASFLRPRTRLLAVLAGGVPFALVLAWYNWRCFGSPLASSYRYLALFPQQAQYGLLGFAAPTWTAFWGITFSPYRGLFFSSPFLLAAVPGVWLVWRARRWRSELILSTAIVLAYLLLISCYYDWKGGFSVAGPRNLISLIPFAAMPVAFAVEAAWRSERWRALVLLAVGWALAVTFVETAGGQAFAPITIPDPLFQFFLPKLLDGDVNRNLGMVLKLGHWFSLVPLLGFIALISMPLWTREGRTSDPRP
jgi:hypothetical protein